MPEKAMSRNPAMAKVVERQMRNWELGRSQQPTPMSAKAPAPVADFITITNNVGAGGKEIGQLLAKRLDWPVFDRDILKTMAADDECRTHLYSSMDERDLGWFEETFRSFLQCEFRKNDYFHRLTETILCLARQGRAIYVGRAADLILPRSRGFRVKIYASLQYRIEHFAKTNGVDEKEAAKSVDRIDRERAAFIQQRFTIDASDPMRFDLMLNIERFNPEQVVEVILQALPMRGIEV